MKQNQFDKLIVSKEVIVNRAVKTYLSRYPSLEHLRQDLKQSGTLGLIEGVQHLIAKNKPADDDAYLTKCVQNAILNAVQEIGNALPIPRSSKSLARKNGFKIAPTFVNPLPAAFDKADCGASLRSQLLECCSTDEEKQIVQLLGAGFSQQEIAKQLNRDFRRISETIQSLRKRFESDEDGTDSDEPYRPVNKGKNGKCRCGKPTARWSNAERCENCEADDYHRFDGRSRRVSA